MDKSPFNLYSSASHLFQRGEMRGVAVLFRDKDDIAKEALQMFLQEHGQTLADMLEGKPTELGITFHVKTDSKARRKENTTPYALNQIRISMNVGRLLIAAGAYDLMKNAMAEISERTGKSEAYLYGRWKDFNDICDVSIEEQLRQLQKLQTELGSRARENPDAIRKEFDNRAVWKRHFDTKRVTLDNIGDSVFKLD